MQFVLPVPLKEELEALNYPDEEKFTVLSRTGRRRELRKDMALPMNRFMQVALLSSLLGVSSLLVTSPAFAVASAEFYGNKAYRYGKFEARVQFPQGDGVIGSFFLWKVGSQTAEVYWDELDFEKIDECSMHLNNIYGWSDPGENHNSTAVVADACTAYHSYAYEWTPAYVAWFIDGVEVRRDTGDGAQAHADNAPDGMIFDFNIWVGNEAFGGTFNPSILPVHEYVSYIQYSEYTPGAGEGGSDFTFSWRESFDTPDPGGWAKGTWASPFGNSVHNVNNVNFQNGVMILSLTADDALGYSSVAPADPMDLPTQFGGTGPSSGGAAGVGGSDSTGAGGMPGGETGGEGTGGGSTMNGDGDADGGGGCSQAGVPARRSWPLGALLLLGLAAFRGRRARLGASSGPVA